MEEHGELVERVMNETEFQASRKQEMIEERLQKKE